MNPTLTIIIPAYNESEALSVFLPKVIAHCQLKKYQLIVINDGSKDNTKSIIQDAIQNTNFQLIHHKVNRGYGGAIKSGIQAAQTDFVITIDADGQHRLEDIDKLFQFLIEQDADMVVGSRKGNKVSNHYRHLGKFLIRSIAKILMPLHIYDINSGMKIYNTQLAQKYIQLCPNSMAFSDIITLVFIHQRQLVLEAPIQINERIAGISTISTMTALETVKEILNIVILFNPMRIFFPLALFFIIISLLWGLQFILLRRGLSTGALLGITTGLLFFLLGLLAEQISIIRKNNL